MKSITYFVVTIVWRKLNTGGLNSYPNDGWTPNIGTQFNCILLHDKTVIANKEAKTTSTTPYMLMTTNNQIFFFQSFKFWYKLMYS